MHIHKQTCFSSSTRSFQSLLAGFDRICGNLTTACGVRTLLSKGKKKNEISVCKMGEDGNFCLCTKIAFCIGSLSCTCVHRRGSHRDSLYHFFLNLRSQFYSDFSLAHCKMNSCLEGTLQHCEALHCLLRLGLIKENKPGDMGKRCPIKKSTLALMQLQLHRGCGTDGRLGHGGCNSVVENSNTG